MAGWLKVNGELSVGRDAPKEDDLRDIAANGFRSVLDLRQDGDSGQALSPQAEEEAAGRLGLRYARVPVPTDRFDDVMLDRFRAEISRLPVPVFAHCASGKRSGTFAIAHAAIEAGLAGRVALDRIEAAGAAYGSAEMREAVRRYVDRHMTTDDGERYGRAAGIAPAGSSGVGRRAASLLPTTTRRVEEHTADRINRRIRHGIESNVRYFAAHPEEIGRRLAELDREWDMERTLEANAATLALAGTLLGVFADRRFLVLPVAVTAFLLQHALQGWCPPVPFFRKRGVRTAAEIERERTALKALRGDFRRLADAGPAADPQARAGAALAAAGA